MDQIVQAMEGQQIRVRPVPPSALSNLDVPFGCAELAKCGDNDQQHSVGQSILVNLVFKRAKQEQRQDGCQNFRREEPDGHFAARDKIPAATQRAATHKGTPGQVDDFCRRGLGSYSR